MRACSWVTPWRAGASRSWRCAMAMRLARSASWSLPLRRWQQPDGLTPSHRLSWSTKRREAMPKKTVAEKRSRCTCHCVRNVGTATSPVHIHGERAEWSKARKRSCGLPPVRHRFTPESNSVRSMINASEIISKHLARTAEVGLQHCLYLHLVGIVITLAVFKRHPAHSHTDGQRLQFREPGLHMNYNRYTQKVVTL